jgi:DNA-binding NtrC family response regulator
MRTIGLDYAARGFRSEELLTVVARADDEHSSDSRVLYRLRTALRRIGCFSSAVLDLAYRAAKTTSSLLILGEEGSGKELLAEAIHRNSVRSLGPFVSINLATLRDTPAETQLFGPAAEHDSGAVARLEAAHHGTVFLDQIAELPATAQSRLLQLLEKGSITHVASNEDRRVDVRVIAASGCDLQPLVAARSFREDLYNRLSILLIRLPPLRERPEDIGPFVNFYVREFCREKQMPEVKVDQPLVQRLERYVWPGNVRQLSNCLERMVVACRGQILTVADVPADLIDSQFVPNRSVWPGHRERLSDIERTVALRTLHEYGGNRTRAAHALGISVRTLQRRLKEWAYRDSPASR